MKKIISGIIVLIIIITILLIRKIPIKGTWQTTYSLGNLGEIKETYIFKNSGKCKRIINNGYDIENDCTYKINKDKIKIVWEDKLDKKRYSSFKKIDKNTIIISQREYKKIKKY